MGVSIQDIRGLKKLSWPTKRHGIAVMPCGEKALTVYTDDLDGLTSRLLV